MFDEKRVLIPLSHINKNNNMHIICKNSESRLVLAQDLSVEIKSS